ncbi:hypothetical protein SK128_028216 [Halocaridina rubra]|uniref:Uncharacterized protein n=1 Tax=Halocaridina rubra TaxID=373956 RepID=A0AAN8WMP1_HALRR
MNNLINKIPPHNKSATTIPDLNPTWSYLSRRSTFHSMDERSYCCKQLTTTFITILEVFNKPSPSREELTIYIKSAPCRLPRTLQLRLLSRLEEFNVVQQQCCSCHIKLPKHLILIIVTAIYF